MTDEILKQIDAEIGACRLAIEAARPALERAAIAKRALAALERARAALVPRESKAAPKPRAPRGLAAAAMRRVCWQDEDGRSDLTREQAIEAASTWASETGGKVPSVRALGRAYDLLMEPPEGADEIPIAGPEEIAEANAAAELATDRAVADL